MINPNMILLHILSLESKLQYVYVIGTRSSIFNLENRNI